MNHLNTNLTPEERRERARRFREQQRAAQRRYEQKLRESGASKYRTIGSNRERKARLYERNFGDHAEWIRGLPCDTCGAPAPSDPSHAVPRGMGGCGGDRTVLFPQCRTCHEAYEEHRGPPTREEAKRIAAGYWARSPFNPENSHMPEHQERKP